MTKLETLGFLYTLAVYFGTVAIGLLVAVSAMLHDGVVALDFNHYGEGWLEALGLAWAVMLTPWVYVTIRNAVVPSAEQKNCPRCNGRLTGNYCIQCGLIN